MLLFTGITDIHTCMPPLAGFFAALDRAALPLLMAKAMA
jgi:hypothetical protein